MKSVIFRRIFGRSLVALTLVGILTFSVSGAAAAFKNIKVGDQALPVQLEDLEGQEHSLANYTNAKAVLLLFWATWSERSLTELADLKKFQTQYSDKGLQILAINVENQTMDAEDVSQIKEILEKNEISYPVLLDKGLKTYNEWGVIATPTTAIVSSDGVVTFDLSSYPTSAYFDMDEAIQKALGLYVEEQDMAADAVPSYVPAREALLRLGLGKRHAEKGFMSKALPELEKAAVADTRWAEPHLYLGFVHFRMGNLEKAGASLQMASVLDTQRVETTWLRAYLLVAEEKVDDAISLLQSIEPEGAKTETSDPAASASDASEAVTAAPDGAISGTVMTQAEPSGQAAGDGSLDISEVISLKDAGKASEAGKTLEDLLLRNLEESGFTMKKKKKMDAMERMKLMMEKKQGK